MEEEANIEIKSPVPDARVNNVRSVLMGILYYFARMLVQVKNT